MSVVAASAIHVETTDGVATVTLDRPPLNVLTTAMLTELDDALRGLEAIGDLRLVVLRGAGRAFSAGVDVGEHEGDALGPMLDAFARVAMRLLECDIPTLAVVHGAALGGGCEIVACCDLAVAADDAKLGTPEVTLGVVAPLGAALFPSIVGAARARALLLTGETISGATAEGYGLVWRSVPREALEAEVASIAQRFRGLSAAALRLTKRTIRVAAAQPSPLSAVRVADLEQRRALPEMHDAAEGLRAFLEKRAPRWLHR